MYHLCCHCRQFKSIPTGIPIKPLRLTERSTSGSRYERRGRRKIGESDEELEIESEEKARGEKIEIDEDRLPSRAMAIHEHIRRTVKRDGARCHGPLLVSYRRRALNGRVSARQRDISCSAGRCAGRFLLENLGYTFGFVIVIMARQQLFTENTVTAVLPVMQNPTLGNFGLLMRLWSVVLLGNIIGTGIAARRLSTCRSLMNPPGTHL